MRSSQLALSELGGAAFDPNSSRFIRTSWMLDVKRSFAIPSASAAVRFFNEAEALRLEENTRKRNVFSRHSYERDFYLQRIREFANRSVIEVVLPGDPKGIADDARRLASVIEAACVVSTVLYAPRKTLHARLGITAHRKDILDFTVGPVFRYLSASSRREAVARGVTVDKTFAERFQRLGLDVLVAEANKDTPFGRRLRQALLWLLESRLEHSYEAALVKAAIAFEALLGGNENEPLRRTLSEAAAFLLSDDTSSREAICRLVKSFYDARSQVVHGGLRRKTRAIPVKLLEGAERIMFLILITLADNVTVIGSDGALQGWVEQQKWGRNQDLRRPFRPGDLKRTLNRAVEPRR
jgi:hypothetical protein